MKIPDELFEKYGPPIGITTDKGYVFWDDKNKCKVYQYSIHELTKFTELKKPYEHIGGEGIAYDSHEEGINWNFGAKYYENNS